MPHSSTNYFSIIFLAIMVAFVPVGFALIFTAGKIHWVLALLLNVIVWWLYLEMFWNAMIKITVVDRTITVSKPFRKNSVLSRKKHHQIVIREDEWDQLFYWHHKGNTCCYFRQGRTVAYFFAADGFTFWTQDLQRLFPEKRFKVMENGVPGDVVKALKREFPERVL